ncbi:MAG: TAXI family TRAP transporter solute-binding subunit [Desulfocapsa sp.]|nr:TAXI family TRAP transporter solute-binding subunit [Desulfocapsa sp.]
MKKLSVALTILFLAVILDIGSTQAGSIFVTIGTGGITGVYYPTGGAIAKMVNKKNKEYGIRATVESTGGSVFNINAIMAGDMAFGIVQSDRQFQAMNGMAEWKAKGPQTELRAVFSIHPEAVTLVTASDAGIKTIRDLKVKRVNIGNPGSGQRQNAIDALTAVGIDYEKDIIAESIKASEAAGLLQDNRIDAFFYTVGHPSGSIKEVTSGARKVVIADIAGVDSLLEKYPYYTKTSIPIKLYPGADNKQDVITFGVKATLCTSSRIPDDIVYAITKEVFDNLEEFRTLHPAFSTLTKGSMLTGISAPFHPGAMKYFKEVGLK